MVIINSSGIQGSPKLAEINPSPRPQLQVGMVFKLSLAMDMAADMTRELVTLTDAGRLFGMSYYLKGVFNSNFGVRNSHRNLSNSEQSVLEYWKWKLCGTIALPVPELNTILLVQTTLRSRGHRTRGRCGVRGGRVKLHIAQNAWTYGNQPLVENSTLATELKGVNYIKN